MNKGKRTDLALEAVRNIDEKLDKEKLPEGVKCTQEQQGGCNVTVVDVESEEGARALCKPIGRYITLELDGLLRREEDSFEAAVRLLAEHIRKLMERSQGGPVLVAGLGNRYITPDAVGPETLRYVVVTRHLKQHMPEDFKAFRSVSAFAGGVLGSTGVESSEMIDAVVQKVRPSAIIAVDALAASDSQRLCRTVQVTNTGITPGSGVGNSRSALNEERLGLPVIAVGVPTVVDATGMAGFPKGESLILTPRDIDSYVRDVSKLVGYGINLALHDGLTIPDVDMLVS